MASVDPNSWQSLHAGADKKSRVFITQLVRYLGESFSSTGLAQSLSGSNRGVKAGALKNLTVDYPASGSQTANCADAYAVYVSMELNSLPAVLTLSNLLTGSPVTIAVNNSTGASGNFQIHGTNGLGASYLVFAKTTGSYLNMVTVGVSIPAGNTVIFTGNSSVKGAGPDLELVYN